ENPLDHRLVKRLLPGYLEEVAELEAKKAKMEAAIKGTATSDDDEREESEDSLSETDLKAAKKELAGVKKRLKATQDGFAKRLQEARSELDEDVAFDLVLGILRADLDDILGRYEADHRQLVVAAFEGWWNKYASPKPAVAD
ncbi:MAG: SAM-dependent DNA methyltransferase, partial [bacterium]|nr:SAM-dependent DNA methyltransferase [bacterium]